MVPKLLSGQFQEYQFEKHRALGSDPAIKKPGANCLGPVVDCIQIALVFADCCGESGWQCVLLRVPHPLCGLLLYLRKTHCHPDLSRLSTIHYQIEIVGSR